MKCEDCIHYDVCIDHKECKHYSPSAQWLYSVYPIGTEVFEVRKRTREQTTYINGKRYRYNDYEWDIEKYAWDWAAVLSVISTSLSNVVSISERKMSRFFDDIEDAVKCRDKLNAELREENNDEHNDDI